MDFWQRWRASDLGNISIEVLQDVELTELASDIADVKLSWELTFTEAT